MVTTIGDAWMLVVFVLFLDLFANSISTRYKKQMVIEFHCLHFDKLCNRNWICGAACPVKINWRDWIKNGKEKCNILTERMETKEAHISFRDAVPILIYRIKIRILDDERTVLRKDSLYLCAQCTSHMFKRKPLMRSLTGLWHVLPCWRIFIWRFLLLFFFLQ